MSSNSQADEFVVRSEQVRIPSKFMKVVTRISAVMVAISAAALGIMMFLTVADLTGRNFLHPINGSELIGMLLIVASSLSLGWCQITKGNISIDVLSKRLKPRGQAILNIFSYSISVAVTVIICWQGTKMMLNYMSLDLGGRTAILSLIIWPFWLIITLGLALVTVVFCIDLYQSLVRAFKK
jgi:TRAP-type C4-dicarboxylate transport system permease small subunit